MFSVLVIGLFDNEVMVETYTIGLVRCIATQFTELLLTILC